MSKRCGRPASNPIHQFYDYGEDKKVSICKAKECKIKIKVSLFDKNYILNSMRKHANLEKIINILISIPSQSTILQI